MYRTHNALAGVALLATLAVPTEAQVNGAADASAQSHENASATGSDHAERGRAEAGAADAARPDEARDKAARNKARRRLQSDDDQGGRARVNERIDNRVGPVEGSQSARIDARPGTSTQSDAMVNRVSPGERSNGAMGGAQNAEAARSGTMAGSRFGDGPSGSLPSSSGGIFGGAVGGGSSARR